MATTGAVGAVGVAGAATDEDVYSKENGGPCFSETATGACQPGEQPALEIETGDTVTWHFAGNDQPHNVWIATDVDAENPDWVKQGELILYGDPPTDSHTFGEAGEYEFICDVHRNQMRGTISVTGETVETPTPDPDPTTQPGGGNDGGGGGGGGGVDDHTRTPAPDGGPADAIAPTIEGVTAKALRRGARVRFGLSEPASVKIRVKRRGRRGNALRTVHVQAPAGTSRVKVRGKRLRRGRYLVQLRARDAMGNRSTLAKDSFRGRRR